MLPTNCEWMCSPIFGMKTRDQIDISRLVSIQLRALETNRKQNNDKGKPCQTKHINWSDLPNLPCRSTMEVAKAWIAVIALANYGPNLRWMSSHATKVHPKQSKALIVSNFMSTMHVLDCLALWSTSLVRSRVVWIEGLGKQAPCCSIMDWSTLLRHIGKALWVSSGDN